MTGEIEIDIYRNRQTGKSWRIQSMCDDLVVFKRGVRVETLGREDFDRLFVGVA